MAKKVAVCIPAYNAEKTIPAALESVLSQSYGDLSVLVYDDGSVDGTAEAVEKVSDKRVRLIRGGANQGGVAARSALIRSVKTDLCMWLDADDRWIRDDFVSEAVKAQRKQDYDMVSFVRIRHLRKDTEPFVEPKDGCFCHRNFSYCGDELFRKFFPTDNHFIFNSKIFKTELLRKSVPDDLLEAGKRYCTDDVFFSAMWWFNARSYLHVTDNAPFYEYRDDVGIWGSHLHDISLKRFGDLCILQHAAALSLLGRMTSVRPLHQADLEALTLGVNLPMTARMIKMARKEIGCEYADWLAGIWRLAFCRDGMHPFNGIDAICLPQYCAALEKMMF